MLQKIFILKARIDVAIKNSSLEEVERCVPDMSQTCFDDILSGNEVLENLKFTFEFCLLLMNLGKFGRHVHYKCFFDVFKAQEKLVVSGRALFRQVLRQMFDVLERSTDKVLTFLSFFNKL